MAATRIGFRLGGENKTDSPHQTKTHRRITTGREGCEGRVISKWTYPFQPQSVLRVVIKMRWWVLDGIVWDGNYLAVGFKAGGGSGFGQEESDRKRRRPSSRSAPSRLEVEGMGEVLRPTSRAGRGRELLGREAVKARLPLMGRLRNELNKLLRQISRIQG